MATRFVFTFNLIFLMLILGLAIAQDDKQQDKMPAVKAFPTAEGFGAKPQGGRGGRIIEVTNLNDAGAGSLRQALEVETGPRIVVFRVSGTIDLKSDIRIRGEGGSFVTVAGQTSPGGVQLKGDGLVVMDGAPADRGGTKVFMEGNLGPNRFSEDADDWSNGVFNLDYWKRDGSSHFPEASQTQFRSETPFVAPAVTTVPARELKSAILPIVGASKPARDELDTRIVKDVMDVTGNIDKIGVGGPWPVLTGGLPPTDSDHDGMPDAWESAHEFDPTNPQDGPRTTTNGYTNVENYLNELAGDGIP